MLGLLASIALIFLVSPFAGAVVSFAALYFFANDKNKVLVCLFYLSLFLGLINIHKGIEGDLIAYYRIYMEGHENGLFSYIRLINKEPLFSVFNHAVFLVTNGSFLLYQVIFTVVCYMLIFLSIWRFHKKIRLHRSTFILAIGVALLFPNIFLLSTHLMRQFFAASLIMLFIIEYIFYKKKGLVYFILSFFIHTTSLFFSFLFLPFFNKLQDRSKIFYFIGVLGGLIGLMYRFAGNLASFFSGIPVLSYAFYRIKVKEDAWQTDKLGVLNFLLQLFVVFIFYKMSVNHKLKKWELPIQKLFITSLILFVFVAINYNNTEIALRFSFYMYFLFPFAIYFLPMLLINNQNVKFEKLNLLLLILVFLFWFVYKINYGIWTYSELESLLLVI